MNDTRFKELLNLYLDHRLSAKEAVELEQMLQSDPSLRRRMRAYETMHRGCAELFRRSASDAPAPDALVQALRRAEDRIRAKNERRAVVHGWTTWGAAAGAAALVALMVARISQPGLVAPSVAAVDSLATPDLTGTQPSSLVATTSARSTAIEGVVVRRSLPEHLTLAALGIAPESKRASSGLSSWSPSAETTARVASAPTETAEWMAVAGTVGGAEWTTANVSTATFTSRPISGWGQTGSGFQAQTAGFTFER